MQRKQAKTTHTQVNVYKKPHFSIHDTNKIRE